ncbi:MAG: hypothetical protein JNL57_03945 [Bacteroidetes bacterium]|nr:hypothetical protein [Bacteroidota bacterium]
MFLNIPATNFKVGAKRNEIEPLRFNPCNEPIGKISSPEAISKMSFEPISGFLVKYKELIAVQAGGLDKGSDAGLRKKANFRSV